jgi:drug/metabolite transporter (DMT)-like permease
MAAASLITTLIAGYFVVQWVFLSSSLILYNKQLISGSFRHPVTLVLFHMLFGACAAATWRGLGWENVPAVGLRSWVSGFLPVGVCFAASLALSNMAYIYISVAYIQMIKALTPVIVLLISFAIGIEAPTLRLTFYIVLISLGVTISCASQIDASIAGTVMQLAAIFFEALRLCLINILLAQKGLKLSAIANLFYIAPTCFLCLLGPWAMLEAPHVLTDHAAAIRDAVRHHQHSYHCSTATTAAQLPLQHSCHCAAQRLPAQHAPQRRPCPRASPPSLPTPLISPCAHASPLRVRRCTRASSPSPPTRPSPSCSTSRRSL